MKVYNTLSRSVEEFVTKQDKKVTMYVCGPTVYDLPHLGHARCYITWDMVVRYLRFRGYDVIYARNITDIDDKIINKAKATNSTTQEIAEKYYLEFVKAMNELNVLPPNIEPKATDNIHAMIDLVKILIGKEYAYENNGNVYFRVAKFAKTGRYGHLCKQNLDDLQAGARVETSEEKEEPMDFALWKSAKTDEISWDSPWGKGRPGWHLECSAMVKKHLGDTIDIHAGGQDLMFPHHENEKAQSEAAYDADFAKYWMHNGFVVINQEKMSKSLGNFVTIQDLLEKYDANTIRFFILTNHYRMPIEFGDEGLQSAKAGVRRLKNAVEDIPIAEELEKCTKALDLIISEIVNKGCFPFHDIDKIEYLTNGMSEEIIEYVIKSILNFINSMDDDFNTSKALAILFDLASNAQKCKNDSKLDDAQLCVALLLRLSEILGFDLQKVQGAADELVSQLMEVLLSVRNEARNQKNWSIADKVRNDLTEIGIVLKDQKDGKTSWTLQ